jgi:hypothetical protein
MARAAITIDSLDAWFTAIRRGAIYRALFNAAGSV